MNEWYVGAHLVPVGGEVEAGEYYEHGERAGECELPLRPGLHAGASPRCTSWFCAGSITSSAIDFDRVPKWVMIKEPNGSHAADTIVSLLPRSRMLFLLRDGRDVVDWLIDAMLGSQSWWAGRTRQLGRPPQERLAFVAQHSELWVRRTMASQRAFESLSDGQRLLVRYEDILSDTSTQLRRICDRLGLELGAKGLATIVERNAFDSAPKDRRGPGKPMRAATPGLWRENLTEDERRTMHEMMGAKLAELGNDVHGHRGSRSRLDSSWWPFTTFSLTSPRPET